MSRQLAFSIGISVLAMVSFALLGQEAGAQLARDARSRVPFQVSYDALPRLSHLLPILQ
jgi:hypothetical protein